MPDLNAVKLGLGGCKGLPSSDEASNDRDVVVGERKSPSRRLRRGCDKEIAEVGTEYCEEELDSTTND